MVKKALLTVLATAIFWAAWWAISALSDSALLPSPWQTLAAFFDVVFSPRGMTSIGDSTYRVVMGTLIGSAVGTTLGIATRYSGLASRAVSAVFYPLLQSVPTICWALIFVMWFGLSDASPMLVVATAVAPFFIINIWEGMKELDTNLVEMASMYTGSRVRTLNKIILPMLYPYIFAATKSSFMVAWKVVIVGEIFGATSGMGYMLAIAFESYRIAQVFAWTLAFALILLAFDYGIFNFLDRKYMRKWKPQEQKS